MAWIGKIQNGPGIGPYNMYPNRTPIGNNVTDWQDPLVPKLDDCKYACGGSGFFSGEDAKDATRWDGLMLYLGKLRNTNPFWRQILLSDNVLLDWLNNDDVKNALTALLYSECFPGSAPAGNYKQICDSAAAVGGIQAQPLIFICKFFEKANTDPSYIKKTIYRSLSYAADTEQCKKSGKEWMGNQTICWLCNQNITNINIGGTEQQTSNNSIHYQECEHCLPYIVGNFILKLYGGNPKIAEAAAKKMAATQRAVAQAQAIQAGASSLDDFLNTVRAQAIQAGATSIEAYLKAAQAQRRQVQTAVIQAGAASLADFLNTVGTQAVQAGAASLAVYLNAIQQPELAVTLNTAQVTANAIGIPLITYLERIGAEFQLPKTNKQILQENAANIKTALYWQKLEYEWSHKYCNQIKSQGHFLDYDEQTGKFGIDYVQIANFSKRLRCQGSYKDENYTEDEKACRRTTGSGTLKELNWKTFTDETGEIQYKDKNGTPAPKNIRTSCNPKLPSSNPEASCRVSFFMPSEDPDINSTDSEANKYLQSKLYPLSHTWTKDTDGIIQKMILIRDALNTMPDPKNSRMSIGLASLTQARVSSFIIAKYLEDIAKQLQNPGSPYSQIWSTNLPIPWKIADDFKFSPTGGDTKGIASKFVLGLARCCEAAIRSKNLGILNASLSSIELQSWIDGCVHSSNSAYISLDRVTNLKGDESAFGRALTRAYKKAAILMANPMFVIPLLISLSESLKQGSSPLVLKEIGFQLRAGWQDLVVEFGTNVVSRLRTSNFIFTEMGVIAESIIPSITTGVPKFDGSRYNPQWNNVARVITENIQNFIPHLWYYSSSIIELSRDDISVLKSNTEDTEAGKYIQLFLAAPNTVEWLEDVDTLEFMLETSPTVLNKFWNGLFENFEGFLTTIQNSGGFDRDGAIFYISNYLKEYVNNENTLDEFLSRVELAKIVASFSAAPDKVVWLEGLSILKLMSGANLFIVNKFWNLIIQNVDQFIRAVINPTNPIVSTMGAAIAYISNYLSEIVKNEEINDAFLNKVGVNVDMKPQIRSQSRRDHEGFIPEFRRLLFGKINSKFGKKSKRKAKNKPKSKPKRKAKSKPKSKADTALKNKLKMVGIKVTKKVKGKRVKLTRKELQKKLLAFKKLQAKARKLKITLKYKSTSGRYKFKSQKRLISDMKKNKRNKRNKKKN